MNIITTDQLTGRILSQIPTTSDTLRNEALEVLQQLGIPQAKHEEYKHTPIARYLDKNFKFDQPATIGQLESIEEYLIPKLESQRIVFVNGRLSEKLSRFDQSQIEISSLAKALNGKNSIISQHLAKYADYKNDALSAWNTAAWTDGVFVRVADNTQVEKPIAIYHLADASETEVTAITRNLVVVGKNAQVTIIEKYDSVGSQNHFSNFVNEFIVEENGGLEYYSVQNDKKNRFQHLQTVIYQKRSSRANTYTFTLEGKFYRNNLQLVLDGEGIESHMYGLYLVGRDTLADNHTVVDHMKPNSFSNELYKGIMDDSSKGVFNGKIYVRPNAQKTNAFQANRNILLTDQATVNTKPQLEIWADDVKCSHGCTTGQLDEEALFYLRSRGIEKDTARAMMLYAFAGDVVEHVPHPVMKEYIDGLISDRLHKNF